jgi:hypothetical protein
MDINKQLQQLQATTFNQQKEIINQHQKLNELKELFDQQQQQIQQQQQQIQQQQKLNIKLQLQLQQLDIQQ